MTETLDIIASRYSCRSFQDTPVPEADLRAIAESAVRAPSAKNRQPWRIIVITDKQAIEEIDRVGMERLKASDEAAHSRMMGRGGRMFYNATAMLVVVTEELDSPYPVSMDSGIVASHAVLAAASLGVNSCIAAVPRIAFDDEAISAKYIPAGFQFSVSILLGYAATEGSAHEPDLGKIIYM